MRHIEEIQDSTNHVEKNWISSTPEKLHLSNKRYQVFEHLPEKSSGLFETLIKEELGEHVFVE